MSSTSIIEHRTMLAERQPVTAQRFEILEVIGEGASGFVYRALDTQENNREVALKILTDHSAFDEQTKDRFLQEIKISQEVHHPNLVQAYDLIIVGDTVAFSMELVKGQDLSQLIGQRAFTFDEIDAICDQSLSALSALHERNICHRDIKPDNILMQENGTVKVSDLGLVKELNAEGRTQAGLLLGTAQYMPPEYVTDGKYDQRSDLFALGLVTVELLMGKRRLTNLSGMQAIEHLIKTNFALSHSEWNLIPKRYHDFIRKTLSFKPELRFQSAEEMRRAIREMKEQASISPHAAVEVRGKINLKNFAAANQRVSPRRNSGQGGPIRTFLFILVACALLLLGISFIAHGP